MQQIARFKSFLQPSTLRPGVQKVLANTGWLFADRIFRMLLSIVVLSWTARYLGPDGFGLLNYATAFALLLSSLANLGMDSIVVRDLVRNPEHKDELLGTAFFLRLPATFLTFLITAAAIVLLRPDETSKHQMVWIIGLGTIFLPFEVWDFWFQSIVSAKYSIYARNITFLIACAIRITLIVVKAPLVAFAWVMVVENAISAIALTIVAARTGNYIVRWKPRLALAGRLLSQSWPLMLSGLAIAIYLRIDQLMLEREGDAVVGIYSAAVRISELWYFVPTAIVASVSPTIIKAKQISEELYERRQLQLFTGLVMVAYVVAIGVTLMAPLVIWLLYGDQYAGAGTILSIHIWTGVFVALGVARQPWTVAENMTMFSFWSTAAGAVVNVILNIFWIPRYGAIGASMATLIAQFVAACGVGLFHPKARRMFAMQMSALMLNRGRIP